MTHPNAKTSSYYPALPRLETLNYCAIYCTVILWSIGTLLPLSKENETRYLSYDNLDNGWYRWIGRHKDIVDFEWVFWESCFFVSVVIGFVGHFIIARIADKVCPHYRFDIYCVYSVLFTVYYLRIQGFLFLLSHFALQYIVAILTKSLVACWASGCLLAYSLTTVMVGSFLKSCYPEDEYKAYFVLFTAAMCNLRYISFSVEYIWSLSDVIHDKSQNIHSQKRTFFTKLFRPHCNHRENTSYDLKFSFKDLIVYQMYYPLCYGGPVINYNEFFLQIKKPPLLWDLCIIKNFMFGMGKFSLWHIVLDILLHFFYVPTMATDYALISRLPLFSVLGLGLGMVMFFWLKYVCMYGLTSYFSSSDNLDAPGPPHCIFIKHRVTDMWKFFDKGLHLWLVRYIYIPLGGSKIPLLRFLMNSMMPFAFVYVWHGLGQGQAYWACLSWMGVFIEGVSYRLYKADIVLSVEAKYLTPTWSRRMRAMLSAPLQCLLLTSNLFFLWSFEVALLYCKRLFLESFKFILFLWLFFYSGCQTSMELHRMGVGL